MHKTHPPKIKHYNRNTTLSDFNFLVQYMKGIHSMLVNYVISDVMDFCRVLL